MKLLKILMCSIALFLVHLAHGQVNDEPPYPQDIFIAPVAHPIILSGSFAEPRSNHFHAGIDIKPSNGKTGDPILAVADGVISRIIVHPSGYGNSILIDHQNGYSSLYAHLDRFSPEIAALIKTNQYKSRLFMQRLHTDDIKKPVAQGDVIGFLGNSGKSHGAHLHFEIRNSTNDHPLNPMLFGIKPKDTKAPELMSIKIYALDQKDMVKAINYHDLSISSDTVYVNTRNFQLSIEMLDRMNGASNKNGVYKLEAYENGRLKYAYQMDELDFDHGRDINAHIDYWEKEVQSKNFSFCHHEPTNQLPIYSCSSAIPYFNIKDRSISIKIRATDFHGNFSEILLPVQYDPNAKMESLNKVFNYGIISGMTQLIERENFIIYFPKNSLIQDDFFYIENHFDSLGENSIKIKSIGTALFEPIQILLKKTNKDTVWNKYQIVKKEGTEMVNLGRAEKDSFIYVHSYSLGDFYLMKDTIPPTIKAVNFSENMPSQNSMSFEIYDNLKPSGSDTYIQYEAFVDDHWILFEYDLKNDRITHFFDPNLRGFHQLKIILKDFAGNQRTYQRNFYR